MSACSLRERYRSDTPGRPATRGRPGLLLLTLAWGLTATAAEPFVEQWRRDIGIGYAPPVLAGDGEVVAVGNRPATDGQEEQDLVWCCAVQDGAVRWQQALPVSPTTGKVARYPGPRAAPAIGDDEVLVLAHDGRLRCLERADGSLRWERSLLDWGGAVPSWGYAGRPLLVGERGYLHIGGTEGRSVAFALDDGALLWSVAVGGAASHTDPVLRDDALLVVSAAELLAQDLDDGAVRWRHEWRTRGGNNSPPPLAIAGSHLLLSSAYRMDNGAASRVLTVADGGTTSVLWEHDELMMHTTQALLIDGHLFGAAARIDRDPGGIVCLDALTGQRRWLHPECNGTLSRSASGSLLVLTLDGLLIEGAADPSAWRELGRQQVVSGDRCWSPPLLVAPGLILVRSEAGQLIALRRDPS